jgi:zinc protease
MGGGGTPGVASFVIQTKRANLPAVLDLLRQIIREPSLPANEFEQIKQSRLTQLEASRTEPLVLGSNRLQRALNTYPKDDVRYVPTIDESMERLRATTIEQVRTLYRDYLGAGHGELAIVGDFEPSEVLPIIEQTVSGWVAKKPYARIERPYQPTAGGHQTLDLPDKANAAYFAGTSIALTDHDPDYPAMVAGNFILGGGAISSRIADRLRQKGGLSYTARTTFNAPPIDDDGTLTVMAIYNPKNVDKVIDGVNDEVAKLLEGGVTRDELEKAAKGLLEQETVRRSNDAALASTLANNLFLGRTLEYEADLEKSYEKLTPEAVSAVLRKYLDPNRLAVITAGDFAQAGKSE